MAPVSKKQVMSNAKWIIACKIIQSLLQMVIGMLCARYLGSANYGLINYAASIVGFAMPVMRLGLNDTLVGELTDAPEREGEIMGTALTMNLLSGLVCMAGVFGVVSLMNPGDTVTILVCVLYSTSIVFGALETIQYWFQYKLLSRYSSVAMVFAYLVVSAYRVVLLMTGKSVYWFALTHSVEYGVVAVALLVILLRKGIHLSISWRRARKMFSVSKYYIMAALMVVVFQNTDHIMLTTMKGTAENGIYSAAITCVTMTQFVYLAIVDSFRPMILQQKKYHPAEYERGISGLYGVTLYLALAQSVVFTLLARPIVWILYGQEYIAAAAVIRILNWYFIFSMMGVVRNVWILAENQETYLWRINLIGALANVVLTGLMSPLAGAAGAALASLLTQAITNFVVGFLLPPIRRNNILLLRGLRPGFFLEEIRTLAAVMGRKARS